MPDTFSDIFATGLSSRHGQKQAVRRAEHAGGQAQARNKLFIPTMDGKSAEEQACRQASESSTIYANCKGSSHTTRLCDAQLQLRNADAARGGKMLLFP